MTEPGQARAEWSERTARQVMDNTRCPRCGSVLQNSAVCAVCGAVLNGREGVAVWEASVAAAEAIRAREALIVALPLRDPATAVSPQPSVVQSAAPASSPTAAPVAQPAGASHHVPAAGAPAPVDRGGFSVQSLLAVAGAGLFAVAAVVFVFFNPGLGDLGARTVIVGAIAAVFLGAAGVLAHRGLRFSGEAVGALGAVFVVLTALGAASSAGFETFWVSLGFATLFATALLFVIAQLVHLRSWQWFASVGLMLTPLYFGFGGSSVLATSAGALGSVAAGLLGHLLVNRSRVTEHPATERNTITVLQVAAALTAATAVPFIDLEGPGRPVVIAVVYALLAFLAVLAAATQIRRFWSFVAGASAAVAITVLPFTVQAIDERWLLSTVPLFASIALVSAFALRRTLGRTLNSDLRAGALSVFLIAVLPAFLVSTAQLLSPAEVVGTRAFSGGAPTVDIAEALTMSSGSLIGESLAGDAAVLGLVAAVLGLALAARVIPSSTSLSRALPAGAAWLGVLAALATTTLPGLVQAAQIALALVLAVGLAAAVTRLTRLDRSVRLPGVIGAHLAIVLAALISWETIPWVAVIAGVLVLAALAAVMRTVPPRIRFLHVGAGYAYALGLVATALEQTTLEPIAVLSLTVSVGAVAALATTAWQRVPVRSWYAVLVVTAVPFLLGVATVLVERTGWTALSTALIVALAVSLVLTSRPGLSRVVRVSAAALIIPAVAVVLVTLGAWLLESSGSPVVLPVISVVVALALASLRSVERLLQRRGHGPVGRLEVAAIQLSAFLTAAITVLLSLLRDAAGLGTTVIVLLVLGIGSAAARLYSGRRWGWWLAAACWTGAVWSGWALAGVGLVEAYLLPPALAAAVVGVVLLALRREGLAIAASGLAIALVPTLVLLAVIGDGSDPQEEVPWRASALLASALLLLLAARIIGDGSRFSSLRGPLLVLTVVAAAAGPVQAVRYGTEIDALGITASALMLVVLLLSAIAVALAVSAVARAATARPDEHGNEPAPSRMHGLRRAVSGRWWSVPALLFLVAGPITAIRDDWFTIWTLWALMLLLLVVLVVTVHRAVRGSTLLPPVAVTYAVAWLTGVVGWSERELRVEWFSLPLGLAVLAAGVLAWALTTRRGDDPALKATGTLASWPLGWGGSWPLLGPGILLTMLPSVIATGTDPLTARAILVIALALAAILVGSARRLAAPFVLGLIALPVENVVVFVVQIGKEIGALPWWITLATAGAVLLVLAVTSERKTAQGGGVAARLRELR